MINEYVRLREIGTGSYGNGVLAIAIIFRLSANLSNAFKTEVVKTTNFMLHGVDLYAWDDLTTIIHLAPAVKQVLHRSQEDGMFYELKVIWSMNSSLERSLKISSTIGSNSNICIEETGVELNRRSVNPQSLASLHFYGR